jgi:hypothetical protein
LTIVGILGLGILGAMIGLRGISATDVIPAIKNEARAEATPLRNTFRDHTSPTVMSKPKADVTIFIPTPERTWRSADGRTLTGKVTEIDFASDTITMERTDGQVFKNFPISKLHPEEATLLRAAK